MHKRNLALAAAVAAALAVPWGNANAQAKEGIQLQLSGQVNRSLLFVDDGGQSDTFFTDTDTSSTRFRFLGTAPVTPGLRAGFLWEMEFQSNATDSVTFATPTDDPTLGERHIDLFFEGGWGKLSLGQGDGAANGAMEVDLSGTSVAHYAGARDVGGAFAFRDGAGVLSGPAITDSTSQQDFESRYDRIRYDTPSFAGFSVAGSLGQKADDVREIALRYAGKLGGLGQIAAALGYSVEETAVEDEVTGGSISWLHTSGLNVTFAHSQREAAGRERKFTYGKVGYKFGRHAVSLDFGQGDDQAAAGDEAQVIGIGYVFQPVAWADVYALVKRHSLDRSGASFQDIDMAMIGTRIRF